MLSSITSRFNRFQIGGAISRDIPLRDKLIRQSSNFIPSICKSMNPYTGFFKLFHVAQAGTIGQPSIKIVTNLHQYSIK